MTYRDLSDEDKIELAIQFVAIEQPLPEELKQFLWDTGLYDLIVNPGGTNVGLSPSTVPSTN